MKRKVILIVTISLLLNGFLPKYSLFSQEYDTLFTLIENQPLLQYYYSLSSIPVGIVNKLCIAQTSQSSPTKKNSNHQSNSSSSSCEFAINLSEVKDTIRNPLSRFAWSGTGSAANGTMPCGSNMHWNEYWQQPLPVYRTDQGVTIVLFVLLLLFVLLPRGALGDSYFRKINIFRKDPVWKYSISGLLIGGSR